jgi:hypothetical protein
VIQEDPAELIDGRRGGFVCKRVVDDVEDGGTSVDASEFIDVKNLLESSQRRTLFSTRRENDTDGSFNTHDGLLG